MTTQTKGYVKSHTVDDFALKQIGNDLHFEGWANRSDVVDRYGEMVDAASYAEHLPTFRDLNPIMLWQHNASQPIGTFPKVEVREHGLWVGGVIGHGFEPADTAHKLVEQKICRSLSIGFRETKRGTVDKAGMYHVVGLELLEISLVSIPANAEAVFSMSDHGKLLHVELLDNRRQSGDRVRALRKELATLLIRLAQQECTRAERRHDASLVTLRARAAELEAKIALREMFE